MTHITCSMAVVKTPARVGTSLTPRFIKQQVAIHGSPLLFLDCDVVRKQYQLLQRALPGVDLHFALKPLPHKAVVDTLRSIGAYFDLATAGEIELVAGSNVSPDRTIHTHPIKRDIDIQSALDFGTTTFVVDSLNELRKFTKYRDRARVLVRLSFPNPAVYSDLSRKFGSSPEKAIGIIREANKLDIEVNGLSFHVGSQTLDSTQYVNAIERSIAVMQQVAKAGLATLKCLDIGGGFPVNYGSEGIDIVDYCAPIREALSKCPVGVRLIAEPGRFIVAPAVTSVASVMGQAARNGMNWYYLDDGVYGSFSGIMFDHGDYPIEALRKSSRLYPCVLAGPTCDSIDVVAQGIMLPKLRDGDLVIAKMMGAYSWASATEFNFFRKATIVPINEQASQNHPNVDDVINNNTMIRSVTIK